MASDAADPVPALWERLREASRAASAARQAWRARALEAEGEVLRLRGELEALSGGGSEEELVRLRAENALLSSRAAEARQRVAALLARLAVLERRP